MLHLQELFLSHTFWFSLTNGQQKNRGGVGFLVVSARLIAALLVGKEMPIRNRVPKSRKHLSDPLYLSITQGCQWFNKVLVQLKSHLVWAYIETFNSFFWKQDDDFDEKHLCETRYRNQSEVWQESKSCLRLCRGTIMVTAINLLSGDQMTRSLVLGTMGSGE